MSTGKRKLTILDRTTIEHLFREVLIELAREVPTVTKEARLQCAGFELSIRIVPTRQEGA